MFSYNLYLLLVKYFQYDKRFNVEIRTNAAVNVFPWVTFCSLRAFDIITIRQIYFLFAHNKTERQKLVANIDNEFVQWLNEYYDEVIHLTESTEGKNSNVEWSATLLNQTMLEKAMMAIEDFVIEESKFPRISKQMLFYNMRPLLCFTYRFDVEEYLEESDGSFLRPYFAVRFIDGQSLLPTEEDRARVPRNIDKLFAPNLNREGIEVYIHPPNSSIELFTYDFYIKVLPGQDGAFYINSRSIKRLGPPYGKCLESYPYEPHPEGTYRPAACFEMCMYNKVISQCNCKDIALARHDPERQSGRNEAFRYCEELVGIGPGKNVSFEEIEVAYSLQDNITWCSYYVWINKTMNKECNSQCIRGCEEYIYDVDKSIVTRSTSNENVRKMADKYVNTLVLRNDTERLSIFTSQEMADNAAEGKQGKLDVNTYTRFGKEIIRMWFEMRSKDLVVTETSEIPEYSINQLLSDIGGQLGLWIGMSVITVLEIADLLFNLLKLTLLKAKSIKLRKSTTAKLVENIMKPDENNVKSIIIEKNGKYDKANNATAV